MARSASATTPPLFRLSWCCGWVSRRASRPTPALFWLCLVFFRRSDKGRVIGTFRIKLAANLLHFLYRLRRAFRAALASSSSTAVLSDGAHLEWTAPRGIRTETLLEILAAPAISRQGCPSSRAPAPASVAPVASTATASAPTATSTPTSRARAAAQRARPTRAICQLAWALPGSAPPISVTLS